MNIWLIKIGESLPGDRKFRKLRTVTLAEKLSAAGHEVTWWTSAFDHLRKEWVSGDREIRKISENFRVITLKGTGYRKNISFARYVDLRIIARKFGQMASLERKPDMIIASIPDYNIAFQASVFAKRNNVPFIVDIRDTWPDLFLEYVPSVCKGLVKALLFRDFKLIKKTLNRADGILAVTGTFLKWGLDHAGRDKTSYDRVFYLGYSRKDIPGKRDLSHDIPMETALREKFVVSFVGTFSHTHNPSVMVEAARLLPGGIHFFLAGEGQFYDKVKGSAAGLANVHFTGWLDEPGIDHLLRHTQIGICPSNKNIDLFPNKAFLYLAYGIPVLSSFDGDLRQLMEKYGFGSHFNPGDPGDLAAKIEKLFRDNETRVQYARNAAGTFDNIFDADKIYEEYIRYIESMPVAR